jgi:hypothetical protein
MRGNHQKKNPADLTPQGRKLKATKTLTQLLRRLGDEAHTVDDEGAVLTKFQALAKMIWDKALGYTEEIPETGESIIHKPDKSYVNTILERVDGKVAPAVASDGKKKATLADRIGEQSKVRLNALAKKGKDEE